MDKLKTKCGFTTQTLGCPVAIALANARSAISIAQQQLKGQKAFVGK